MQAKKTLVLDHMRQKNTPIFEDLEVLANELWAPGILLIRLRQKKAQYLPGQFAMVKPSGDDSTLLARPYSIYWVNDEEIQFLYKIYGSGTKALSQLEPGSTVSVLGPLGNSFVSTDAELVLLVAGGIGIAPFPYLVEKYFKEKQVVLLFGNQNKSQIILNEKFKELGTRVIYSTDDGSCGHQGYVTEILKDFLKENDESQYAEAYVCGPRSMERSVVEICRSFHVRTQVAMEEYMACGIGVCMGCVVPASVEGSVNWSYKRVCVEGPIFFGEELKWN